MTYIAILAAPIEGKAAAGSFPDLVIFAVIGFGVLFLLTGLVLAYADKRLRDRQAGDRKDKSE